MSLKTKALGVAGLLLVLLAAYGRAIAFDVGDHSLRWTALTRAD